MVTFDSQAAENSRQSSQTKNILIWILILHQIPFSRINYHLIINHDESNVIYMGEEEALKNIPTSVKHKQFVVPGGIPIEDAVMDVIQQNQLEFDQIIAISELHLLPAAVLREKLKITGPTVKDVEKVRNKVIMKDLVAAKGLRVPQFAPLSKLNEKEHNSLWAEGKIVLKPVDGAGSENTKVYSSLDHLVTALNERATDIPQLDAETPNYEGFEVEEFIPGPILHIDGLVVNGKIKMILGSEYIGNCLDYINGKPLGSVQIDLEPQLVEWVASVLSAVDIKKGGFHLEVINNNGEPVFLEIGNRIGGGDIADNFERATGVNPHSMELKILLDQELDLPEKYLKTEKKYGFFVFPGHHYQADYCLISGEQKFRENPFILRWNQLTMDNKLPTHNTYVATKVPIAGVVGGNTSEELKDFIQQMFAEITIEPISTPL